MKISFKATIVILLSPLLAACGGNFYSQSGSSGASRCETLANNYWSEYQAYKDARAANNGVETKEVMSHYYASAEYNLQFLQEDCEGQGYELEGSSESSDSSQNSDDSEQGYPSIVIDFRDRLNSVSSYEWTLDPFNDLSDSGSLGVVLSAECGLWIFNSQDDIQNAYNQGLFLDSQTWFGTDSESGYGIMLMTNSRENQCAYDVVTAVNWNGLN